MQFKNLTQFLVVALGIAGMALAVGCGDDSTPPATDSGTPDSATDAGPTTCATADPSKTFVVDVMDVGRENPTGVAPGFDLDMRVSDDTDAQGCFQPDFTSPEGAAGIDNQLAVLAPTIESAAGTDLAASISDSIAGGTILIMPIIENLDDNINDSCVNLTLLLGKVPGGGAPALNTAGTLASGQTFDIDPNSYDASGNPLIHLASAEVVNGHLQAGPVDISLALPVSGSTLTLNIRHAIISFDIAADGTAISNGLLGGELIVEELITAAMAISDTLPIETLRGFLTSVADLSPNATGDCESLSVALVFSGIPAVEGVLATPTDAGTPDAGADAGTPDAGSDAGSADSGTADAGTADTGV